MIREAGGLSHSQAYTDTGKFDLAAMIMDKNFDADVNFSSPGDYLIKVKAVIGKVKLLDSFSHSVP